MKHFKQNFYPLVSLGNIFLKLETELKRSICILFEFIYFQSLTTKCYDFYLTNKQKKYEQIYEIKFSFIWI